MAVPAWKSSRIDIAGLRRAQIVQAAIAVIAEQGLPNLSLAKIEGKVGMSRGQLTYYFKTKESILLAVFDRLLDRMNQEQGRTDARGDPAGWLPGWDVMIRNILGSILEQPSPEFRCLHFTFLAEIGHRRDFRRRLATLYEGWRSHLAQQLRRDLKHKAPRHKIPPRALATLVQAFIHGIAIQHAADPDAVDFQGIVELFLDLVGRFLWPNGRKKKSPAAHKPRTRRRAGGPHSNEVYQ